VNLRDERVKAGAEARKRIGFCLCTATAAREKTEMVTGWGSTHPHLQPVRRSHDESDGDSKLSRSSSPDGELLRRSGLLSDDTPRQTPATTRFLANDYDSNRNQEIKTQDVSSSSKRLGFFADKLSSSFVGPAHSTSNLKSSLHPSQLLHPHSHTRNDSTTASSTTTFPTMTAPSSMPNVVKSHSSPSKASYGRTYDSKLVSREMHRLGNLAHLPSALAPPISSAPSVSSLNLPAPGSQVNLVSGSTADPWKALHVHVLPLFNGEPLRIPIEDLNVLVKRHIQSVVSSFPSKALGTLQSDVTELIASGMVTLNAKLTGIDDEKLVGRVVEIWGFFLGPGTHIYRRSPVTLTDGCIAVLTISNAQVPSSCHFPGPSDKYTTCPILHEQCFPSIYLPYRCPQRCAAVIP